MTKLHWFLMVLTFLITCRICKLEKIIISNGTYDKEEIVTVSANEEHVYWFRSLRIVNPSRISVRANRVDKNYPVMAVIAQQNQITSWEVPLMVTTKKKSYMYHNTSRTLCFSSVDYLNSFYRSAVKTFSDINKKFSLTIKTFSPRPITVSFVVNQIDDYNIKNDKNVTVIVSPSEPSFYYYSFRTNKIEDENVFININSFDDQCLTVSLQRSLCPVRDLNDDITYEGNYLTMNRNGAMYTTKKEFPEGFFLVFVVRPDNYECTTKSSILPMNNEVSIKEQMKHSVLYFKVSKGISRSDAVKAILIVFGGYAGFCLFFVILTLVIYLYKNWHKSDETDTTLSQIVDPDQIVMSHEEDLTLVMLDTKPEANDKKARNYCYHIANIGLFYGLPVIQLMISYQRAVDLSGNEDICYHNFKCAHPGFGSNDFNHIYSNIGYFFMGILFISLVISKQYTTKCSPHHGIPKYYGLFYAMGIALILEGFLSACYHICPNQMNFQFDTSFMYTMAILIVIKLYQSRHPDVNAPAYGAFTVLGVAVFLAMIGIMTNSMVVLILFLMFYCCLCIYVSFKIYYFGHVLETLRKLFDYVRNSKDYRSCFKPIKMRLFILLLLANIFNYTIAGVGVYLYPKVIDFGTYLLILLMSNSVLYMTFYIGMKFHYKETLCVEAILYGILALCLWIPSSYFFFDASTLWSATPAESRQLNTECILFNFFDGHDVWHMLSALALFFSFMLLLTIDDNLNETHKNEIHVF